MLWCGVGGGGDARRWLSANGYSPEWQALIYWLVQQRKNAGLSQRQLARNIGVVHSLVGKVEKGERRLDPVELVLYCKGMDADPCDLIEAIRRDIQAT